MNCLFWTFLFLTLFCFLWGWYIKGFNITVIQLFLVYPLKMRNGCFSRYKQFDLFKHFGKLIFIEINCKKNWTLTTVRPLNTHGQRCHTNFSCHYSIYLQILMHCDHNRSPGQVFCYNYWLNFIFHRFKWGYSLNTIMQKYLQNRFIYLECFQISGTF